MIRVKTEIKSAIMKPRMLILATVMAIAVLSSCTATYVVRERPREVVYTRPAAPSYGHVWVTGDWVWQGGRYQWREGHWEVPRRGMRWADGHWVETPRGYKWVPGHWQRF